MTDILLVTFFAGNEIDHPRFFAVEMGYYRECFTRDGAGKFSAFINEGADETYLEGHFVKPWEWEVDGYIYTYTNTTIFQQKKYLSRFKMTAK